MIGAAVAQSQALSTPSIQLVIGQGIKKLGTDTEFAAHCPEFALSVAYGRHQLGDRRSPAGNRDHLAGFDPRKKL
jgi:hypothetical protein